jgi:hypothetical protein
MTKAATYEAMKFQAIERAESLGFVDVDAGPGNFKADRLMLRASELEILPAN